MTARRLVVLRHAKAAHPAGVVDWERPLTESGERDARRAGATLTELGLRPDLVLCSPSSRTRRTAALALPDADVSFEPAVYEAYADELLALLRRSGAEARTLALVGHNPGVQELVGMLDPEDGAAGFPPGAFAVVETDDEWAGLGTGRVITRWSPKED
ncbi:histidine phosphatase family protein [Streptosporangium sp. NPDC023615]|uniref:SixA phosphatase family protein n=1 Tax=Streptosporangium sp. NPDC023615 TaxID=3154794 RepID=UPI0034135021